MSTTPATILARLVRRFGLLVAVTALGAAAGGTYGAVKTPVYQAQAYVVLTAWVFLCGLAFFSLAEKFAGVMGQVLLTLLVRATGSLQESVIYVIFFFVVGMEIRREVYCGELSEWRRAAAFHKAAGARCERRVPAPRNRQ